MPGTQTDLQTSLLSIENLCVEVRDDDVWVPVVENVDLRIGRNEIVGLVGESGSGKTLTAMSILRLLPRTVRIASGTIAFEGVDLTDLGTRQINQVRGGRIGVVFQEPMSSLNPAFTVGDQIAEVVRRHRNVSRAAARVRAVEMMELVGIPSPGRRIVHYPHQFSGGMRQRVMIAMALACEPSLLIADEPTTALDVTIQADILDLVRRLRRELDMGILLISHDLGVVSTVCERVNVMYAGQVVELAGVETLFETPRHPYTEGLLQAMPHFKREDGRMGFIPGRVPGVGAYGDGCRFAPRCPYSIDSCVSDMPEKRNLGGHQVRCIRAETLELQGVPE